MTATGERGKQGERMALEYLKMQGYVLLEQNWRYGHKELDLVMRQGETVVFVEVKARSSAAFGTPGEAVTARKQRNLIDAANMYLIKHGLIDTPARMDVAEVDLVSGTVTHIENAFGA